jgi:hypothetical protein
MKKISVVALLACLVLTALFASPALAKKKKGKKRAERVEVIEYSHPTALGLAGAGGCAEAFDCVSLPVGSQEAYISVEITDTLGQDVYAEIWQDLDGDDMIDQSTGVCGSTSGFVLITPGVPVNIPIFEGPGIDPPCTGVASAGTVTVTFSNLP